MPTGLRVSTDYIGAGDPDLLSHQFEESNVVVEDGYLQLIVPGGQEGESVISTAEITTDFDILYGSVSTYAILTEEPGVCNGLPSTLLMDPHMLTGNRKLLLPF